MVDAALNRQAAVKRRALRAKLITPEIIRFITCGIPERIQLVNAGLYLEVDRNVYTAGPIALRRGKIHKRVVIYFPIYAAFGRNDTATGGRTLVTRAAGEWPVGDRQVSGILLLVTSTTKDGEVGVDVEFRVRKYSLRLIPEVLIGTIGVEALKEVKTMILQACLPGIAVNHTVRY